MEITALIIVSILSGCIGYLISSTMKHVHETPRHININQYDLVKNRVQLESEIYVKEDVALYDLTFELKQYVIKNRDIFIEMHEVEGKIYYTFEFYTKNK